jgi:5-hydroxyisourate hydrolase-like protein (transthyretin family)
MGLTGRNRPKGNGRRRLLRIGLAGAAMAGASRAPGVRAQPNGELSVHALDATIGKPAEGIVVDLFDVSAERPLKVGQAMTGVDGQADLIKGVPVKVGHYFRRRGLVLGNPPFLDVVPIRLYLGNAQGNYHVPVVFTPWSYTMHG